MIIDDVISAGTSVRESLDLIKQANAQAAGVVIALDRQEKGKGDVSAINEIENNYHIPVDSIIKLEHLISYLQEQGESQENLTEYAQKIEDYRQKYGC